VMATIVFAGPLVPLVFGTRVAETAAALKKLIWAIILRYVNYALNTRLLAIGHEKVFVVTSLLCLAVNLIGNLLLIPIFSWRAAAALTIVTEFVLLVQNIYWLKRVTGAVPRPLRWVRTSLVFGSLILVAFAGAKVVPPLAIGSVCLFSFLVYLYSTGMVGEFATVWHAEPSKTTT
jgi:O-antigen/teichoic acid export membrane protein